MNNGLSIIHKPTHDNPFVLGLTAGNEVLKRIIFIIDDIIVLFYGRLYDMLCLTLGFWFLPDFG